MKKTFFGVLALGAMIAFGTPAGAAPTTQVCPPQNINPNDCADPSAPQGQKCRANTSTDVTAEAQTQSGVIEIGPLAITSTTPATAWCQIYVDGNPHPSTVLDATITGAAGAYVAAGARPLSYGPVFIGTVISMCTFANYNGSTHYWQPDNNTPPTSLGKWSDTFDVTKCAQATQIDPNPPVCPVLLTIDAHTGNAGHLAETWQDCEPYEPII